MTHDERFEQLWHDLKEQVKAARGEGRTSHQTAPNAPYDNEAYYMIGGIRQRDTVFITIGNGAGWNGVIAVEAPALKQLAADALAAYLDIQDAKP